MAFGLKLRSRLPSCSPKDKKFRALEIPDLHHCQAAIGYCELECSTTLTTNLSASTHSPAPPGSSFACALQSSRIEELEGVTSRGGQTDPPGTNERAMDGVACLRDPACRFYRIREECFVERAADIFKMRQIIPFNLACYFCQLGELESAKEYLGKAFKIDPELAEMGVEDKDLEPLWDFLGQD